MLCCGGGWAEAIIKASCGRLHAVCVCDGGKVVGSFKFASRVLRECRAYICVNYVRLPNRN